MAKNVIIMIGDGMGWEMTRAAAVQAIIEEEIATYKKANPKATNQEIFDTLFAGDTLQDPQYYTEGRGFGTSYQNLEGYTLSTTSNTYIHGSKSNSALKGKPFNHNTEKSKVRNGFEFNPTSVIDDSGNNAFNKNGDLVSGQFTDGNVLIYDKTLGGETPWDSNYYGNNANPDAGFDQNYIKAIFPDSAGTATTLCTSSKTYVGAIGVDIFEQAVETLAEKAMKEGKSAGVVSSVPFNHATPAAAISHVNQRNKTTELSFDDRAGNKNGNAKDDVDKFGHPIDDHDNIFTQIFEEVKPTVILGGGHPYGRGDNQYLTDDALNDFRNGFYEDDYTFLERGAEYDGVGTDTTLGNITKSASEILAETASGLDPDNGDRLFGIYGGRGQGGNLPWRSANDDYSRAGIDYDRNQAIANTDSDPSNDGKLFKTRPLDVGESDEQFINREIAENPTLTDLTKASLDILGDDDQGFWLMIEGGDIDWSNHANDMDANLGTLKDFDESVAAVQDWIQNNGGYDENLLIVTADHDHYLTLKNDFPALLAQDLLLGDGGEGLSAELDSSLAGHYWGSESTNKNEWGTHTSRPVPVYYQGAGAEVLDSFKGKGFESYGKNIPGIANFVDQVHIAETMSQALTDIPRLNIGDFTPINLKILDLLNLIVVAFAILVLLRVIPTNS